MLVLLDRRTVVKRLSEDSDVARRFASHHLGARKVSALDYADWCEATVGKIDEPASVVDIDRLVDDWRERASTAGVRATPIYLLAFAAVLLILGGGWLSMAIGSALPVIVAFAAFGVAIHAPIWPARLLVGPEADRISWPRGGSL